MAQQIHAGQYRLELDGHRLVVRDQSGEIVETMDNVETAAEIRLPDGTTINPADLADALADPTITDIDTAAGGDTGDGGVQESGGLGLTAFIPGSGIGGFSAVGGQEGTTLGYGNAAFSDDRPFIDGPFIDGQALYKVSAADAESNSDAEAPTYAPIAEVVNLETDEDSTVDGAVTASDQDKDPLGFTLVDAPQHGTIQFDADGSFSYKPDANYNGPDSFTYIANDGSHDSNVAAVNITVTPVNDAPVADDAALTLDEDTTFFGAVTAKDAEGDQLGYALVDGPQHGDLTLNADGTFVYKPDADYTGADSFTYRANDGNTDSAPAKIDINVTPVDDAPVADDSAANTDEDTALAGQVIATDVDSSGLGYQIVSGPEHGSVDFKADGSFIYKPDANYSGADSFTYRANDGSLSSNTAKVDITVKPANDAPVVMASGGHGDVHIVSIDNAHKLTGAYAIGDYLAGAGKESAAINAKMINGVDTSNLTLSQATETKVDFLSEGAGYKSMVGTYTFDAKGDIDPTSLKFLWLDGTAVKENAANAALVKDFLGNTQPASVSLGQMAAGTQIGFFIVADGAANAANTKLIANLAGVKAGSDDYAGDLAAINAKLGVTVDAHGNGHIMVNGTALNGNTFFTHNAALNTDANSNDMLHTMSGISSKNDGKLYIGFEDLAGGGDKDYNDIIIAVDIGSYNINKLTQGIAEPSVHIADIDSTTLSSATVSTAGFHVGDHLNVPSGNLFDVTASADGNDTTIQVTAKSGAASIADFESFLNGIFFSSSSTEEGERTLHYSVTDAGGAQSNIGDAHIELTASYDISASQLGARTALGGGDDTLHLNQTMSSHLDAGSGYDVVRLEQANMSFGQAEAAKLHNIEAIDASGFGKNAVTLSVGDVVIMTDANHHLTVIGNSGDSLKLVGDGTHHWQVTDSDANFTTVAFNDGVHQAIIAVSNELSLTVS